MPYYKVIDVNKDYTFKPTIFDEDVIMLQNEYRQVDKNSEFKIDYAFIDGFKSSITKKDIKYFTFICKPKNGISI